MMLSLIMALQVVVSTSFGDMNHVVSMEDQARYLADITAVKVTGPTGKYSFRVTISSPDKGCNQYADWWEVIAENGQLIYRRILAHSHTNEQPFTRQGGTVEIDEEQNVWVRGHMNNSGYGGKTFYGNVKNGFAEKDWPEGFAPDVEKQKPQPSGCAF